MGRKELVLEGVLPISRYLLGDGKRCGKGRLLEGVVLLNRVEYWREVRGFLKRFRSGSVERLRYTRGLALGDLFFFMVVLLRRVDANNDFVFNLCRNLEMEYRDNFLHDILHLYARGHFKSSIITTALTIRELCSDSELTYCIFSHTRDAAKKFMGQIKREFEVNEDLKILFPDVCWGNPERESSRWSLNDGIVLKRKGNPKEGSIEAWGVVDRQPIGRHFDRLIYDDLVTKDSVSTSEQLEKTVEGWRLSLNLDSITKPSVKRYIGTRYHYKDAYDTMMQSGIRAIVIPATKNGKRDGEPVLLSREALDYKIAQMGDAVSAAQLFLDPLSVSTRGFKEEWLRYYESLDDGSIMQMNRYILVDPAKSKKSRGDYTVMLVIGLGADDNYYLLHGVRDKLRLSQKTDLLFKLVQRYKPMMVGYEQYGAQTEVESLTDEMERRNYRFPIMELSGKASKDDRIDLLVPLFESRRVYLPRQLIFLSEGIDGKMIEVDFMYQFLKDEYNIYPFSKHDDMLDCFARIKDPLLKAMFPLGEFDSIASGEGVKCINSKYDRFFSNGYTRKAGFPRVAGGNGVELEGSRFGRFMNKLRGG